MDSPRFSRELLAFLIGVPLAWAVLLMFHPGGEATDVYGSVRDDVTAFLVVHLGTVVPGAPANVGTYQFFTVLGLTLFGVDKGTAAGFSLVVFALLTVPLWAIGFWALGRSGVTLTDVRAEFLKNRLAVSRQ